MCFKMHEVLFRDVSRVAEECWSRSQTVSFILQAILLVHPVPLHTMALYKSLYNNNNYYYISHEALPRRNVYWSRLSVCLSVPCRIPTLQHRPGCKLGKWQRVPSSCALLGVFTIGAWVSLL